MPHTISRIGHSNRGWMRRTARHPIRNTHTGAADCKAIALAAVVQRVAKTKPIWVAEKATISSSKWASEASSLPNTMAAGARGLANSIS